MLYSLSFENFPIPNAKRTYNGTHVIQLLFVFFLVILHDLKFLMLEASTCLYLLVHSTIIGRMHFVEKEFVEWIDWCVEIFTL